MELTTETIKSIFSVRDFQRGRMYVADDRVYNMESSFPKARKGCSMSSAASAERKNTRLNFARRRGAISTPSATARSLRGRGGASTWPPR